MANYTNEPPENLNDFLTRLKFYLDKAYTKPDKEQIKKLLKSAYCNMQKTGNWGSIHGHAEVKVVYYVLSENFDLINHSIREHLKEITYNVLQSLNCGLEVIELDFFPLGDTGATNVEDELLETIETAKNLAKGIKLPEDLITKGKEMSEAYLYIYFVENAFRLFIEQIQQSHTLIFPNDVKRTIEKNKQSEAQSKFLPLRGASDLYYCDFVQLQQIIVNNWEVFKTYFPQQDQHWLRVKIEDMYRVRNLIAHCGYASKDELQIVKSNFKMIIKQLEI